jgi:hypothetical protein
MKNDEGPEAHFHSLVCGAGRMDKQNLGRRLFLNYTFASPDT